MRPERVAAVLLAAGQSTRFGEADKMMADYRGKPLAVHALESLASLPFAHLIAVVRPHADAPVLHRKLDRRNYDLLVNARPEDGLSGSIALAAARATDLKCQGILICLADMPDVPQTHLMALCLAAVDIRSVVASTDGLISTPPAFIGRKHFPELIALKGDVGARAMLSHALQIETSVRALHDVDTPDDLRR